MAFFDPSAKSRLYESQLETKGYSPVDTGAMGFQSNDENRGKQQSDRISGRIPEYAMKDKILSHCFANHLPAQFQ